MGRTGCFVLALVVAAIFAVTAVSLLLLLTSDPEPTTVDDAVSAFREELGGRAPGESPVPEGVYVYATDGYEKTDALTGVTNRYPVRTTITVTGAGCGLRLRWNVSEGRSTEWLVCVEGDEWLLAGQDERHTFFGRTERTTYTCRDTLLRPPGDLPGTTFRMRCSTGSTDESGASRVVARATMRVDREDVETVHLRRATVLRGATRGTTRHDIWLDRATGVPVRLVMTTRTANDAPIGEVRYEEQVALLIDLLEPRR